MRGLLVLLSFALVVLVPPCAFAQSAPEMHLGAETDTVGVGESLVLELQATSDAAMPTAPTLGATPGFVVRGQSSSPSQTHMSINGQQSDHYTLTVQFALEAQRVGTFRVGPPAVTVGPTHFAGAQVTLHVVPAGQAPPRRARPVPSNPFGSFSPFDPWRQLFPGFGGGGREPEPAPGPPPLAIDPKLSLETPRGNLYFLHAAVDKPSVVVGEQVTLSVYEYLDTSGSSLQVDADDVHEPRVADFAKQPLLRDDQEPPLSGYASAGGRTWQVRLARRWALFPLRSGDLDIGPMTVSVLRPRQVAGQTRATETLTIHAADPPLAGRPAGYALGDVGRFAVAAEVTPREIEQGAAVGVHVEVTGTGNVPSALRPPVRQDVEWLAPEVHEALGPIGADGYGGKRTFDYVVRLSRPGDVLLGELTLPYWDPDRKKYTVARAPLGMIHVKPVAGSGSASLASADPASETLGGMPAVRTTLEGTKRGYRHLDDTPWFWVLGVAGGPLSFGLAFIGRAAKVRIARAAEGRRTSPRAELRARLARARNESLGPDPRALDAATSRALASAAFAHAGVSVLGAIGAEVATRLEAAGIRPETAAGFAELLRECESARFDPGAADLALARARYERAARTIAAMGTRG